MSANLSEILDYAVYVRSFIIIFAFILVRNFFQVPCHPSAGYDYRMLTLDILVLPTKQCCVHTMEGEVVLDNFQ